MPKRDISKPTYYLDSCVLIDLIEHPITQEPAKTLAAIFADAEDGKCNLVTSILTITEVIFAKHEIDGQALDPAIEAKIDELWHPTSSPIQLVDVHEIVVREAVRLLRDHLVEGWSKTKGNDAIHLVTAKRELVNEFFTTERAMEKWGGVLGFKVCAPHCEVAPDEAAKPPDLFSSGKMLPVSKDKLEKTDATGAEHQAPGDNAEG